MAKIRKQAGEPPASREAPGKPGRNFKPYPCGGGEDSARERMRDFDRRRIKAPDRIRSADKRGWDDCPGRLRRVALLLLKTRINGILSVRNDSPAGNDTLCRRSGSCFRRSFCRHVRTAAVKTQIAPKHGGNRHTAYPSVQLVVVASRYQFPLLHTTPVPVGDRRSFAG